MKNKVSNVKGKYKSTWRPAHNPNLMTKMFREFYGLDLTPDTIDIDHEVIEPKQLPEHEK